MKTNSKKGQTLVEYIIIVALIAISLIAIVGIFGKSIARKFQGASAAISNQGGSDAQQAVDALGDGDETIKKLGE